jgi:hypothetical protein
VDHSEVARLVQALEDEVNNGGFDQYFFNSAGNEAAQAIEALVAIGADKTAAILRRACARFPAGMPPTEWSTRQEQLLEIVSPDSEAFEEDDAEFYRYQDDLAAMVAKTS